MERPEVDANYVFSLYTQPCQNNRLITIFLNLIIV